MRTSASRVGNNRQIFDLPVEIPDLVVSVDSAPQIVCDDDPGPGDGFVRVAGDVIVENTGCGPVLAGTTVPCSLSPVRRRRR